MKGQELSELLTSISTLNLTIDTLIRADKKDEIKVAVEKLMSLIKKL